MTVRLASEQGLLQQRSINPYQWWALTYMMSYKRWFLGEVRDDFLKRFVLMTDPKRYLEVYASPLSEALDDVEEMPISPSEFADIDSYLKELDKVRSVSGADFGDDDGDGDWQ